MGGRKKVDPLSMQIHGFNYGISLACLEASGGVKAGGKGEESRNAGWPAFVHGVFLP
jgi:hypothetical protein